MFSHQQSDLDNAVSTSSHTTTTLHTFGYLPLTATTKSSSETPAPPKPDLSPASALNPSIPESPTIKRGEYPFRRGEHVAASESKPHLPLSALTKPNTESSSAATPAQSASLSASQDPAVKPGEYPFKRGEFEDRTQ